MIDEQFQANPKHYAKMIPKESKQTFQAHLTNDVEKHGNILYQIQAVRCYLSFWSQCLVDSRCDAVCLRPALWNLWVVLSQADFGLPWSTPGPMLLTFWKIVGANACFHRQRFRAMYGTNYTFKSTSKD